MRVSSNNLADRRIADYKTTTNLNDLSPSVVLVVNGVSYHDFIDGFISIDLTHIRKLNDIFICSHHRSIISRSQSSFQMTARKNSIYMIRLSNDVMWTEGNLNRISAKGKQVFSWIQTETLSSQHEIDTFSDIEAPDSEITTIGGKLLQEMRKKIQTKEIKSNGSQQ